MQREIEECICEILTEDAQKNALGFVAYLRANQLVFERGKGYWADKFYWMIKCKDAYVCFVLINNAQDETEAQGWTIWLDGSGTDWFAGAMQDARTKQIAWEHVDICANCGGCNTPGGSRKTIFGREFDAVCITAFKFINPNAEAMECAKKMVALCVDDVLSGG